MWTIMVTFLAPLDGSLIPSGLGSYGAFESQEEAAKTCDYPQANEELWAVLAEAERNGEQWDLFPWYTGPCPQCGISRMEPNEHCACGGDDQ